MPTIEQIRAARALLGWSQHDLAEKADLSQTGIARIENGTNQPNTKTIEKIKAAFDAADIEFIDNSGVKTKPEGRVNIYSGHAGFVEFLENVYEVLGKHPDNKEVLVNNVSEDEFLKWEGDYANTHQARMRQLNARFKIVIQEGDNNFTAEQYAQYKWIPNSVFSTISFYIYTDNTALINFEEKNVTVYVIKSKAIADFYREEFEKVWRKALTPPNQK